jgi:hypothetical protein
VLLLLLMHGLPVLLPLPLLPVGAVLLLLLLAALLEGWLVPELFAEEVGCCVCVPEPLPCVLLLVLLLLRCCRRSCGRLLFKFSISGKKLNAPAMLKDAKGGATVLDGPLFCARLAAGVCEAVCCAA